jgi:hypothetical protein
MSEFTDALRAHLEGHGLELHPQGQDFDEHERHPTGNRGWKPDIAFVHDSMQGHDHVSSALDGAIEHVLKHGQTPGTRPKKDEDGYDDARTPLMHRLEDGFGHESYRIETENGDTHVISHGCYRKGGNNGLDLDGCYHHVVRIDHW